MDSLGKHQFGWKGNGLDGNVYYSDRRFYNVDQMIVRQCISIPMVPMDYIEKCIYLKFLVKALS